MPAVGRSPNTNPLDRTLVNHDREGEAGMCLGFRHHELVAVSRCARPYQSMITPSMPRLIMSVIWL